jgi:hypothetical protein
MTYAQSVAASFNSAPKYVSPALDPGDLRSAAANRGRYRYRYRAALSALMIVVVALSAFNLFHYSTRLKGWLGTTTPAGLTPVPANAGGATDATVRDTVGAVLDDSPQTAPTTRTRNLPISQGRATAAETTIPRPQPSAPRGPDSAAATGKLTAKASGSIPARQPDAAAGHPAAAPAAMPPADAPLVKEKTHAGAENVSIDRPAKSPPAAAPSDPCTDTVAALGLCSPNMTAKNR